MTGWQIVGVCAVAAGVLVTIFIAVISKVSDRGEWRGEVNADRDAFKAFMQEVRGKLDKIFERLPPLTATTSSPLRLTDLGKKISQTIHAKEWAAELALALADDVKDKPPYEIQETARNYCSDRLQMTEEQMALCGACAYEHGMNLKQVKNVLGIELRDILLKQAGLTTPG